MFLGQGLMTGLRKRQVEEKKCWSLQGEGDPDQMVASLLQMHFTLPYLPLAHSRTVKDRTLSQPLCVWRWVEGVGGSGTCSGPWSSLPDPILPNPSSSSTQMLQLCTAPTDENLILGYWPQTSHPLLTVPISERQIQPTSGLISRGDGFGEWKALFVFAKHNWNQGLRMAPLQDLVLSIGVFLRLLYLSTCSHVALCNVTCTYRILYVSSFLHLFVRLDVWEILGSWLWWSLLQCDRSSRFYFRPRDTPCRSHQESDNMSVWRRCILSGGCVFSHPEGPQPQSHPLVVIKKAVLWHFKADKKNK